MNLGVECTDRLFDDGKWSVRYAHGETIPELNCNIAILEKEGWVGASDIQNLYVGINHTHVVRMQKEAEDTPIDSTSDRVTIGERRYNAEELSAVLKWVTRMEGIEMEEIMERYRMFVASSTGVKV